MKKAIITGATGLVGSAVARYLSSQGVKVLCLGRQSLEQPEVSSLLGGGVTYLRLSMDKISSLKERIKEVPWVSDNSTVFFHFAWQGRERLTDGSLADQLNNAVHATEAVKTAKQLDCIRFVNAGTLEETFLENFLQSTSKVPYHSAQTDYALAKLTARDMCKIVAYVEKMDYIHTRLSVPLTPDLSRGTFISQNLRRIARGEAYEEPENKQLFDIISTDDVARAYYLIGQKGRNKADYFIGTSKPATLKQYFVHFEQMIRGATSVQMDDPVNDYHAQLFNTSSLYQDTGFVASTGFQIAIKQIMSE